jgi:hypothetical protein
MKAIGKIVFALLFFGQFCFAAGNAAGQEGSLDAILRRAEIYVDEDLYKDSEVLAAIQKYVGAVEKNFNFKIDVKSFPVAFVLDSSTLNGDNPSFKVKTSAAELKAAIKKSWEDNSKAPLAGVILIGNLPFAEMEYFVKVSDGKFAYPEDEGPYTNYQRWVADFYFMDLDGEWRDEITGINCENRGKCDRLVRAANGILDAHYDKNGELGSDDFEIWVSRVNPYGEAREHTAAGWKKQLHNYDAEYFPKVKEFLLHWLSKAYNQQIKTSRPDKALYTYSSKTDLRSNDFAMMNYIDNLSNIYNEVDVMWEADNRKYLDYISRDYDWVFHIGHAMETYFESGVKIEDFDTLVHVNARVFDLYSCSAARTVVFEGNAYDRNIALAHIFRTSEGGVTVIGNTKTGGGYQDNDYFYKQLKTNMLGDAYLQWVNHRTLVFEASKHTKDVYEWFYPYGLFGDPFIWLKADKDKVKEDEMPKNIALHAFNDFNISGKCYDETQGKDGRCNVICGSTAKNYCAGVHGSAEIGSIYGKGGLVLQGISSAKSVSIYNSFENADINIFANVQYNYVAYKNPKRWNAEFDFKEPLPEFPSSGCKDVTVDREYTPAVGSCIKNLTVKSSGTLVIPQGDFYAETVNMEKGSKYKFAKPGYYSAMNVKKGFAWDASPASAVADSAEWAKGFKLLVHGDAKEVDLDSAFYGSVYAPNTMVNVRGKAYGTFTGYGVAVHDKSVAFYVPFAPVDGEPEKVSIAFADKRPHAFGKAGFGIVSFDRGVIDFEVDESGMYNVSVLNALGQKVASFNVNAVAGRNTVKWAPARNARGRYVVKIQAN